MIVPRLDAIDLSHWNTVSDWPAVKKAGVVGVLHKATEGTSYADPTYELRVDDAIAAGLLWGAYHYLKPGNNSSIDDQMLFFVTTVRPWDGMRLVIDYEDPACGLNQLRRAIGMLKQLAPSAEICIYGGALLKEQLGTHQDQVLGKCALWIAQYNTVPSWPEETWPVLSLWQYSDGQNGPPPKSCPGVDGPVDCNVFNGTKEACESWFGPTSWTPVPPAMTKTVTVTHGTNILVVDTVDTSLDANHLMIVTDL